MLHARLPETAGLTIAEVAHAVGFQLPITFSRTYFKHRGKRPSEVVAKTSSASYKTADLKQALDGEVVEELG